MSRSIYIFLCCTLLCITFTRANEFHDLYNHWLPQCVNQRIAMKKVRDSHVFTNLTWSLTDPTIHNFFNESSLPICSSIDQLLENVKQPIANYSCRVPWLSYDEICHTIQSYGLFLWSGDSLMRNMIQALLMILKKDFKEGGYPKRQPNQKLPYDDCQCDGIFSQAHLCRDYFADRNALYSFTTVTKHDNACADYLSTHKITQQAEFISLINDGTLVNDRTNNFFIQSTYNGVKNTKNICMSDSKPIFFILEGGSHYSSNAFRFIEGYIAPFLNNIFSSAKWCANVNGEQRNYKINIIIGGVVSSSSELQITYPYQNDENVNFFYTVLENYLYKNYKTVKVLNFLSLTKEGVNRLDGFHSFSDLNLIKAMIVLNAMKLLL